MHDRQRDRIHISILILIPLLVGLFVFNDYGESIDEASLYDYSNRSLQAYRGLLDFDITPDLGRGNFRYYGPAYLMVANLFSRGITGIFAGINDIDAWHLAYFLCFLAGVIGLYLLARRWLSGWTAFAAGALFLFQPLLWGHAFINPKDIPFMTFCILSVLAGLVMQDRLFPNKLSWEIPSFTSLVHRWEKAESKQRTRVLWFLLGLTLIVAIYLFGQDWLMKFTAMILKTAYSSEPGNILALLMSAIAENYRVIPLEPYIPKGVRAINMFLGTTGLFFLYKTFSCSWEVFSESKPGFRTVLSRFLADTLKNLTNPRVIVAGVFLGFTTSVRILGPALGVIVLFTAIYRAKSKALSAFTAYFLITALTAYATWPYLWSEPISRFQSIITYMSDFPWDGKVLFNGVYYPTNELPIGYVPILLGIQYTEPVILLFFMGLIILARKIWERTIHSELAISVTFWGIIPFILFTVLRPSLYDNTRQLLFIVPPLFFIIGLALEWVFQRVHGWFGRYVILGLLLFPGIYSIIDLHPYQYTYYNSLVQGLQGSHRRFESDYWTISFREAAEYLNRTAPANSKVVVYGTNKEPVKNFSRPDLFVDLYRGGFYDPTSGYEYAVITSRYEWDLHILENWQTVYVIQRNGNIFSVVKKRP